MRPVAFTGLSGRILKSTCVEVSESRYASGLAQGLHVHQPAYITAVLAGGYEEEADGERRSVTTGALLFHPAGEEHAVRFRAPVTHAFRIQLLTPMLQAARFSRASFEKTLSESGPARAIVHRMRRLYLHDDVLAPLQLDGLACELVAACAGWRTNREPSGHAAAHRARELIEASLAKTPTLPDLAAAAGCHPMTVARAFRRTFGCSVGSYLRRRRLEEAAHMLRRTDLSISRVAVLNGFSDQAHLTRSLRRHTGHTPGMLRAFKTAVRARR